MLDDFLFGAATSAYQIEGAWDMYGKVPSIWDTISHQKSSIVMHGQTGDVACNHYHLWADDVAMMKNIGLQAYRFSTSWSRIINGFENKVYPMCTASCAYVDTSINNLGIDFYSALVKGLKHHGIEPFVTLYHWDLPQWLDDVGGWSNPVCVDEFVRYAKLMFEALPGVKHWMTFNEPAVFVSNKWGLKDKNEAIQNILIAHAKVYRFYKENYKGELGIALNLRQYEPENEYTDDVAVKQMDAMQNRLWLDPLFKGRFPTELPDDMDLHLSRDGRALVKGSLDFLGVNYYGGALIRQLADDKIASLPIPHTGTDDIGFGIWPQGLYRLLKRLKNDYDNPEMYITESGCCYNVPVLHDSVVPDKDRIDYIKYHLQNCLRARKENVNLHGYFYWSLMDNFEWTFGYLKRFGLIHVDYPTLERIPKESSIWYQKIITDGSFREKELGRD